MSSKNKCPICNRENHCGIRSKDKCWCMNGTFSEDILKKVSIEQINKTYICKTCSQKY